MSLDLVKVLAGMEIENELSPHHQLSVVNTLIVIIIITGIVIRLIFVSCQ